MLTIFSRRVIIRESEIVQSRVGVGIFGRSDAILFIIRLVLVIFTNGFHKLKLFILYLQGDNSLQEN